MIGIYKIENLINGHCYIGQSVDIKRRWRQHRTDYKIIDYPLYLAFRKYGLENFSFEIIEECSSDLLNEREIYWIKYYNSYQEGYNQTQGGNSYKAWIKINDEQLTEIISYLQNTDISQQELAKMYHVGEDTISEINQGHTRHQENLNYPLRQNKKVNVCVDCGEVISSGAIRCKKCKYIQLQVTTRPSKEQLYQELLNNSFVAVGKKYGVSDNAIRKWCKAYGIPSKASEYKKLKQQM